MAQPQYSVEQLIENIKRRCSVPTSQLTYTDQDFALLANDELQGEVVPLIMSTREEYFVDYIDVIAPASGIIDIPDNVVGQKLRTVAYVSQPNPLILINLPRVDLDIVAGIGFSTPLTLAGFYVQGNQLMLYPQTSIPTGTTIRLYYYRRTLVLADPSAYGQVISVDTLNNQIQVTFVPYNWGAGTKLNSVKATSPFNVTNEDLEIVNVSAPTITLNSVVGINVGDYISELGFSAIPQVPIEAHAYLAQLTAIKALEGLGDRTGMEAAQAKADLLRKSLLVMISQRVDGSTKKVMAAGGGLRLAAGFGLRSGYGRW